MLSRRIVWLGMGAAVVVVVLVAVATGLAQLTDSELGAPSKTTVRPAAPPRDPLDAGGYPLTSGESSLDSTSRSRIGDEDVSFPGERAGWGLPEDRPAGEWPAQRLDPERLKLVEADRNMEQEVRNLAGQIRKAADAQKRAELRKSLEELTAKHFDLRQQQRQLQIDRMEAELEKIRQAVQKRTDAKRVIVQRRVSQLLGEQDELAFPPPPTFQRQPSRGWWQGNAQFEDSQGRSRRRGLFGPRRSGSEIGLPETDDSDLNAPLMRPTPRDSQGFRSPRSEQRLEPGSPIRRP